MTFETEQTTNEIWKVNLQHAKGLQARHGDKRRFIQKINRIKIILAKGNIPAKPVRTILVFDSKVNYIND